MTGPSSARTEDTTNFRGFLVVLVVLCGVLACCVICGLLFVVAPTPDERALKTFREHRSEYTAASQVALQEAQPPGEETRVRLPHEFAGLSEDGAAIVYWSPDTGQVVAFYTHRSPFLGPTHCLVYCDEGCTAQQLRDWRFDEVEALGEGWFLAYNG